jgi:hypothetical protein
MHQTLPLTLHQTPLTPLTLHQTLPLTITIPKPWY